MKNPVLSLNTTTPVTVLTWVVVGCLVGWLDKGDLLDQLFEWKSTWPTGGWMGFRTLIPPESHGCKGTDCSCKKTELFVVCHLAFSSLQCLGWSIQASLRKWRHVSNLKLGHSAANRPNTITTSVRTLFRGPFEACRCVEFQRIQSISCLKSHRKGASVRANQRCSRFGWWP